MAEYLKKNMVKVVFYTKKASGLNVREIIFSHPLRIPTSKKVLNFAFHIFEFFKAKDELGNELDFQAAVQELQNKENLIVQESNTKLKIDLGAFSSVSDVDPLVKISKYKADLQKRHFIYYIKVFEKGRKTPLPDHYGPLYLLLYHESVIKGIESGLLQVDNIFSSIFNTLVQSRRAQPETIPEYQNFFMPLAETVKEYIEAGKVDPQKMNHFMISIKGLREPANRTYARHIMNSFIQELLEDEKIIQCPNCQKILPYSRKKKYCNKKCAKSFHDHLDYERRRKKNRYN
jgi:hypothetical protein